jgi:hypothetical protein
VRAQAHSRKSDLSIPVDPMRAGHLSADGAPGSSQPPPPMPEASLLTAAAERSEARVGIGGLTARAGAEMKAAANSGEKRKVREAARGAAGAGVDGRQSPANKRPADHLRAAASGGARGQVPSLPLGPAFAAPLGQDDAALSAPALPSGLVEYANIVRKLQAGVQAGMGGGWTVGGSASGAGTGSLLTTLNGHGGPDALRAAANRRPLSSNTSLLTESGARLESGGAFMHVPRTSGAHLMSISQVRNYFSSGPSSDQAGPSSGAGLS